MDIATEGPTERKTCIVVDEQDNVLYVGGLAKCHVRPMTLHRAFSLFIFDSSGCLLLQQRAKTKYTFPLAWTNTVCSHPRNLERSMEEWIDLRVQDELGWSIKDIAGRVQPVGKLTYSAISDATYGECEVDTLYFLQVSDEEKAQLEFNRDEVEAIDWVEPARLVSLLSDDRKLITPWFRSIYNGFASSEQNFYQSMKSYLKDERRDPDLSEHKSTRGSEHEQMPWIKAGNCSMPQGGSSSDYLLQGPFSYLSCNSGQKNLRSALVRLYAESDPDVTPADIEGLCWIVERTHTASLLHDDIEDKSSQRRGAVCAHLLWGTAQALNTGTFNFLKAARGVDEVLSHRPDAARAQVIRGVLDMQLDLHRGQNADITWGENAMCPSVEQYIDMIDHKTGALFKACAELPAMCSGNAENGATVGQVFLELGRFFQVRDDLCNICDPHYWKVKGFYEDADEGKYSFPVILFLQQNNQDADTAQWLIKCLADKETPVPLESKLKAYRILHDAGALAQTKQFCADKLENLLNENAALLKSPIAQRILSALELPAAIFTPEQVRQAVAGLP